MSLYHEVYTDSFYTLVLESLVSSKEECYISSMKDEMLVINVALNKNYFLKNESFFPELQKRNTSK